jgi:hypothetical protein
MYRVHSRPECRAESARTIDAWASSRGSCRPRAACASGARHRIAVRGSTRRTCLAREANCSARPSCCPRCLSALTEDAQRELRSDRPRPAYSCGAPRSRERVATRGLERGARGHARPPPRSTRRRRRGRARRYPLNGANSPQRASDRSPGTGTGSRFGATARATTRGIRDGATRAPVAHVAEPSAHLSRIADPGSGRTIGEPRR